MVCLRNISVNTLHKGETEDDNNNNNNNNNNIYLTAKVLSPGPSCCNMALGLTQPLTEMSTRNISWG
jgi:hypothetical protein